MGVIYLIFSCKITQEKLKKCGIEWSNHGRDNRSEFRAKNWTEKFFGRFFGLAVENSGYQLPGGKVARKHFSGLKSG